MALVLEIAAGIILAYIVISVTPLLLAAGADLWDTYRKQITLIIFGLVVLLLVYNACESSTPVANQRAQ